MALMSDGRKETQKEIEGDIEGETEGDGRKEGGRSYLVNVFTPHINKRLLCHARAIHSTYPPQVSHDCR